MHFEILIEDKSGKEMLEILLPKIINSESDTYRIHGYGGIGKIPKNLNQGSDVKKQALLNDLPRILKGHGKTFSQYPDDYPACVVIVCDLDSRCRKKFRQELLNVLNSCSHPPKAQFCIAEEEGEAWLLGDINAIKQAYPRANDNVLNKYIPDSICGTWELLKEALEQHYSYLNKTEWAKKITPHMQINNNKSPSFNYFVQKIKNLSLETI